MNNFLLGISFGEMELSPFTFYGLIFVGISFIISFGLASIPLGKNMTRSKKYSSKKDKN
tara:strand:- start:605 stop:781 length:177 start_codon:yes stop_codon:yes gene_type:complete